MYIYEWYIYYIYKSLLNAWCFLLWALLLSQSIILLDSIYINYSEILNCFSLIYFKYFVRFITFIGFLKLREFKCSFTHKELRDHSSQMRNVQSADTHERLRINEILYMSSCQTIFDYFSYVIRVKLKTLAFYRKKCLCLTWWWNVIYIIESHVLYYSSTISQVFGLYT